MNGKRGFSVSGQEEVEFIPKISRLEATEIVQGNFVHEDLAAIEDYGKWTKDALVMEAMSRKHEILELKRKYEIECEKNKLAREVVDDAMQNTKRAVWTARVMQSRLKFLLLGKSAGLSFLMNGPKSVESSGSCKTEEFESVNDIRKELGGHRLHEGCSTCSCKLDVQKVEGSECNSPVSEETFIFRLEYNLGVMLEEFQRKFRVILSNTRKLYAKSEPLGVSKVVWLKVARVTMMAIGDAEEVLLASGEKVFITRDDNCNWGPEQRFDNLFRCAKYIVGGSRYLDLLRAASLEQFMNLETQYFPLHNEVEGITRTGGGGGLETNPVRGMWRSELWSPLVKNLLRLALPAAKNAECLLKVYKNLSHVQINESTPT